jgi:hypothetical protein
MEVLLSLAIMGFIYFILVFKFGQGKEANEAWQTAARKLKLKYQPSVLFRGRRLSGTLNGFRVTAYNFTRQSGKSATTFTKFMIFYPAIGLGLRLTRERFFTGLARFMGAQDIDVGDAPFDDDVLVQGTPHRKEEVIRFLTPARRFRSHWFLMGRDDAVIADNHAEVVQKGVMINASRIEAVLKDLVRIATCMTKDREEDAALGRAMKARQEGRLDEAVNILAKPKARPVKGTPRRRWPVRKPKAGKPYKKPDKIPAKPPPVPVPAEGEKKEPLEPAEAMIEPVEEQYLQGELLYLGERKEEAKKLFDKVLEERPDDSEIKQWADKAGVESPESEEPIDTAETLDIKSVCDTLFMHGHSSFDTQRIFEKQFADKHVTWSGTLRSIEKYSTDFVFGAEAALKVTIDVHELPPSLYGERTVLAFVKFPVELTDRLNDLKGSSVSFEGRLLKVDGFMRNLFITDGRII